MVEGVSHVQVARLSACATVALSVYLSRTLAALAKSQMHLAALRLQHAKTNCENVALHRQVALLQAELAAARRTDTGATLSETQEEPSLPDWGSYENSTNETVAAPDIAESLTAAADEAVSQCGYVYDAASGLYFDHSSQYYYDPVECLYYEPRSGVYYRYDADEETYVFHSQVSVPTVAVTTGAGGVGGDCEERRVKTKKKKKAHTDSNDGKRHCHDDKEEEEEGDLEEGEIDESSSEDETEWEEEMWEENGEQEKRDMEMVEEEQSAAWPPCVRVIVLSSEHLQPGSLQIITCDGATFGRDENYGHMFVMLDDKVSEVHCSMKFDYDLQCYTLEDQGSEHGTFINDHRLAKSGKPSSAQEIQHADRLQIGDTTFELHIHDGCDTCDGCEPALVQAGIRAVEAATQAENEVIVSKSDLQQDRRRQLKRLKKKFGLADMDYVEPRVPPSRGVYTDKAAVRRRMVGSDMPHTPDDIPSSVHRPIDCENKGHALLTKLGWKEGQGLGKSESGVTQPIQVNVRNSKMAGLGSRPVHSKDNWAKANERFAGLDKANVVEKRESGTGKRSGAGWVRGETLRPEEGSSSDLGTKTGNEQIDAG